MGIPKKSIYVQDEKPNSTPVANGITSVLGGIFAIFYLPVAILCPAGPLVGLILTPIIALPPIIVTGTACAVVETSLQSKKEIEYETAPWK